MTTCHELLLVNKFSFRPFFVVTSGLWVCKIVLQVSPELVRQICGPLSFPITEDSHHRCLQHTGGSWEHLTLSAAGWRTQRPLTLLTPHQFGLFFFFSTDDPTKSYKFTFIYNIDIRGTRLDLHFSFRHWLGGILLFDFWLLGFYNGKWLFGFLLPLMCRRFPSLPSLPCFLGFGAPSAEPSGVWRGWGGGCCCFLYWYYQSISASPFLGGSHLGKIVTIWVSSFFFFTL